METSTVVRAANKLSSVALALDRLLSLIVQDAVFLGCFRDGVEWLSTELRRTQCFLKDAEATVKQADERVKNWIREIRDVACEIQDLVDVITSMSQENRPATSGLAGWISSYVRAPFESSARRRQVLGDIDRIKNKILDISRSRDTYGIANLGESSMMSDKDDTLLLPSRHHLEGEEDDGDVVGLDRYKELLVGRLLDPQTRRRSIVAVAVTGGFGMTTLARRVYDDLQVTRYFDVRCWVTVSQNCGIGDLLKNMAKQIMNLTMKEGQMMGQEQAGVILREHLRARIYLIVLDDIWTSEAWDRLDQFFPDFNNGSRVMLTTRNLEVARSADPLSIPHQLPFLNDQDRRRLLCKKAFPSHEGFSETSCCPQELEDVSSSSQVGGDVASPFRFPSLSRRKILDSDEGKLFIGGISWETTEDKLKEHFGNYGEVLDAIIMKDKSTGRSRGFGFVVFADPALLDHVLQHKHTIDGRTVEAKRALSREEQQTSVRSGNPTAGRSVGAGAGANMRTKRIFVGGLPPTLTEDGFRRYFETYGTVTRAVVMYDQNTNSPRGFGYISFDSEDTVDKVLRKPVHDLNGKLVGVERAHPKNANPNTGSGRSVGSPAAVDFMKDFSPKLGKEGQILSQVGLVDLSS